GERPEEDATIHKLAEKVPTKDCCDSFAIRLVLYAKDDGQELRDLNLPLGQRVSLFPPVANPAVHRDDVSVAHLLQIVGGQRRTESPATVKHNLRIEIRHARLNVTLDDPFAQVNCARQMILGEFAFFPHVYQQKLLTVIDLPLHLLDIRFANSRFGIVHNFQKPRWMLMGHKFSFQSELRTYRTKRTTFMERRSRKPKLCPALQFLS